VVYVTLPEERRGFFGGLAYPVDGVNQFEWWPTDDEFATILKLWNNAAMVPFRLNMYSGEVLADSYDRIRLAHFCNWLCTHFPEEEWTNDYKVVADEAMILRGLEKFEQTAGPLIMAGDSLWIYRDKPKLDHVKEL